MTTPTNINRMYSTEELTEMVRGMKSASNAFYVAAVNIGHHAWIEFSGLHNEYIKLCEEALAQGNDFTETSIHASNALPMKPHHIAYLAEKLGCIYGRSITASPANALAMVKGLGLEIEAFAAGPAPLGTVPASDAQRMQRMKDCGVIMALELWFSRARLAARLGMLASSEEPLFHACERLVEASDLEKSTTPEEDSGRQSP